jgi:hypothetical protein
MAWAITQAGIAQQLATLISGMPGGWITFMGVTIAVFLVLGCILEGLPAIVLMAPLMFPTAKPSPGFRRAFSRAQPLDYPPSLAYPPPTLTRPPWRAFLSLRA